MAKKTYEVVGESIVHGFEKGETFVADLAEHDEKLLVDGGHVIVADVEKAFGKTTEPLVSGTTPTA